MMRAVLKILTLLLLLPLGGCMKWEYGLEEDFNNPSRGLFILNEGNFQYGNATLSFYDPASRTVENEVFARANGAKLGDVAQSMTVADGRGWIVVNNSHVVFAIDLDTYRELGRIENLPSPRYICVVSPEKAYISQLWDNRIIIVDPRRMVVTGEITVPGMTSQSGSTEQMVVIGDYVYCNCWSYQNRIIKIDTRTDMVVASLEVGVQPQSLVVDARGSLWVLTDGGYAGNPAGYEQPALVEVDPAEMKVTRRRRMALTDSPTELTLDPSGHILYWINDGIYRMDIDAERLPSQPFIPSDGTRCYGLTVDPREGDIYVADAIDYQQPGLVRRYDTDGREVECFRVGVNPGAFAWKEVAR